MKTNYYIPQNLLGTDNAKTIKGMKKGWTTHIMYLSPFTANSMGINVCPHASAGCVAACLFDSGRGKFENVSNGRKNKTEYFLHDRKGFLEQLVKELTRISNRMQKTGDTKVAVRLNGTSDIRWEKFKIKDNKNIFELFPHIQFYDYTKNHLRFEQEMPKNYSLVFSRSEDNHDKAIELLKKGVKVAMVFDKVPKTYEGFKVVDGDETDLRFLDKKGVIIGLYFKNTRGKKQAFESGFAIKLDNKILSLKNVKKANKNNQETKKAA